MQIWEQYVWLLSWLARGVLAVALVRRQLPYSWLRTWLFFSLGRTALLQVIGRTESTAYLYAVFVTEPVGIALLAGVVLELFQMRSSGLVLVARSGTVLFTALMALAVGLTLITFLTGPQVDNGAFANALALLRRSTVTILFAFALLTLLFFQLFPAPNRPNLVRHHWVLTAWLGTSALSIGAIWFHPLDTRLINLVSLTLSVVWTLGWLLLLTPAGEEVPPEVPTSAARRIEESAQTLVGELRTSVRSLRQPPPRE